MQMIMKVTTRICCKCQDGYRMVRVLNVQTAKLSTISF